MTNREFLDRTLAAAAAADATGGGAIVSVPKDINEPSDTTPPSRQLNRLNRDNFIQKWGRRVVQSPFLDSIYIRKQTTSLRCSKGKETKYTTLSIF